MDKVEEAREDFIHVASSEHSGIAELVKCADAYASAREQAALAEAGTIELLEEVARRTECKAIIRGRVGVYWYPERAEFEYTNMLTFLTCSRDEAEALLKEGK